METQNNKHPQFNGRDEEEGIKEAAQSERATEAGKDVTSTENDLSLGNSIRNDGDVSGTTFGDQSNTAKFSSIGNNQGRADNNSDNSGGSGFSDFLYKAEQEEVSGSSGDALNAKPSDAMQGNNDRSSS